MKTKSLALSYLLSALFGLSIYGQIEDETIYDDVQKLSFTTRQQITITATAQNNYQHVIVY